MLRLFFSHDISQSLLIYHVYALIMLLNNAIYVNLAWNCLVETLTFSSSFSGNIKKILIFDLRAFLSIFCCTQLAKYSSTFICYHCRHNMLSNQIVIFNRVIFPIDLLTMTVTADWLELLGALILLISFPNLSHVCRF